MQPLETLQRSGPTRELAAEKPAPSGKSRMHAEERRRQLLRVAIECFAQRGFGGTKTRDIAAAAGVSEAILFRHFATKEDLYRAILDEKARTNKDDRFPEVEECMRKRDDQGVFRLLGMEVLRSLREDPSFHRLLIYACLEGHLIANMFRERFAAPRREILRQYILDRQREGAFRDCEPNIALAMTVGSMLNYGMNRYVLGIKRKAPSDAVVVEQMVRIALGGLKVDSDKPSSAPSKKVSGRKKKVNGSHV